MVLTDQIDKFLENNKEEILNTLMELMRVPSVKSEALEGMPFGKACFDMLEANQSLFEKYGYKTVTKHELGYAYSTYGNGEKTIGIFSHGDVVPVDDSWIYTKPFEPIIKDRYLIGRGGNDDKSGIVAGLFATKFIEENNIPLNCKIKMITGINEETGMVDIENFARYEELPELTLVPDADFPLVKGERGIFQFNITAKKPFEMIKKFKGGVAYNVVLDKVDVEIAYSDALLNELKELGLDASANGDVISLTFNGRSSHAAHPEKGDNAGLKAANTLKALNNLCENDKEILSEISKTLSDYFGIYFGLESEDEFFGKLTCANGIVDIKDGQAFVTFDVRYGSVYTNDEIKALILKNCEKWNVAIETDSPGYNHNGSKYADVMLDAYKVLANDETVEPQYISGGTYSRHLKNAFSIGNQAKYKYVTPDFPEGHGSYHQPDEALDIEAFLEGIKIIICYILEADNLSKE